MPSTTAFLYWLNKYLPSTHPGPETGHDEGSSKVPAPPAQGLEAWTAPTGRGGGAGFQPCGRYSQGVNRNDRSHRGRAMGEGPLQAWGRGFPTQISDLRAAAGHSVTGPELEGTQVCNVGTK